MIQLTVVLGLLGVGVVALAVAHVRRSRRGSARTTAGHLRNVGGPDAYFMRMHARGSASLYQGRNPLRRGGAE